MRRRAAMFWMLHEAGASYAAIAQAAGLSRSRVHRSARATRTKLHRRSEYVTGGESFMEPLRRAGALLGAAERAGRHDPRTALQGQLSVPSKLQQLLFGRHEPPRAAHR